MPFNSPVFLFLFIPLVIALNAALPAGWRNGFLVVASIFFYAWGEPVFALVAIASSLIDMVFAEAIVRSRAQRLRKLWLTIGVATNLGLLIYCKYTGFLFDNLHALLVTMDVPRPEVILPLGISFIVFEKITYLVDVYRGVCGTARSIRDYLLFVFLFPKLLAGPILKFHEMKGQIEHHRVTLNDLEEGAFRFLQGLAKKVLIADQVAVLADQIFAMPTNELGFATAWLGALAFTVQIYFDFSGYTDMAIGLARMLGFRLRENFNQPYLAVGFADFWRRWHISLSTFIRDYLYVPLGGNRVPPWRVYLNLWVCFLASGLWHGASWTFVIWGAFHGLFVSADHFGMKRLWPLLPRVAGIAITFLLVVIGWVLFRSVSLAQAGGFLAAMATPWVDGAAPLPRVQLDTALCLAAGLMLSFLPLGAMQHLGRRVLARALPVAQQLVMLCFAIWAFGRVFTETFKPFIYFRF
ncbi:MAG: MBOAT family protein [Chelatococcus sp.]|uniref:MBOAT family O-acyltransferase n=1 Tax=Chelatococcus sp. TaxID=1953771 RepID=UPI0025C29870|nr:MBOAT family O-acyltransferase [Chelatococcus sp.]MBX3537749.1 MBOAT family protein [Chelatococcus sp.]